MTASYSSTVDFNEKYSKKSSQSLSLLLRLIFIKIKQCCTRSNCSKHKRWMVGILASLLLTAIVVFRPQQPLSLPNAEPFHLPNQSLGAIMLFKNEGHALIENVLHLYSQGFSHIILINNDSTRELPLEPLKELEKKGLLTLTSDRGKAPQKWANFKAFQMLRFRYSPDWILAVDADEFPRATRLASLLNYLVLRDDEVCSIALPMFFFGSSGRKDQPNSLIQGFINRRDYGALKKPIVGQFHYKTVAKLSCSMWVGIHHAAPYPSKMPRSTYNSNIGLERNQRPLLSRKMEEHLPDALINHYRTQSAHFYQQIKVSRGDSLFKSNARTMETFRQSNEVDNGKLDEALAKMSRQRFPSLYGKITDEASSLAFQSNEPLENPWPLENVMAAYNELRRHQGLAIINAADSGFPDQFGKALRNAALLDPTWDCIVRVPPGHVMTVVASGLAKLCATREASEGLDFAGFVQDAVSQYKDHYDGFVAMDIDVLLPEAADTPGLREAAKQLSNTGVAEWKDWDTVASVKLVPKAFAKGRLTR